MLAMTWILVYITTWPDAISPLFKWKSLYWSVKYFQLRTGDLFGYSLNFLYPQAGIQPAEKHYQTLSDSHRKCTSRWRTLTSMGMLSNTTMCTFFSPLTQTCQSKTATWHGDTMVRCLLVTMPTMYLRVYMCNLCAYVCVHRCSRAVRHSGG